MRLAQKMRALEVYAPEVMLTSASAWAVKCLVADPLRFSRPALSAYFQFIRADGGGLHKWLYLLVLGVALKAAGLVLLGSRRCWGMSCLLRCAGLAISLCWWTVLGVSWLLADGNSIAGYVLLLVGLAAAWTLLRLPALPGLWYW